MNWTPGTMTDVKQGNVQQQLYTVYAWSPPGRPPSSLLCPSECRQPLCLLPQVSWGHSVLQSPGGQPPRPSQQLPPLQPCPPCRRHHQLRLRSCLQAPACPDPPAMGTAAVRLSRNGSWIISMLVSRGNDAARPAPLVVIHSSHTCMHNSTHSRDIFCILAQNI